MMSDLFHFQIFKLRYFQIVHSVLKLFTGFAIAAFIARKLTVAKAIDIAPTPATMNIHQLILMRQAKPCNQLCMIHHATDVAIINASNTSSRKSFDKRYKRFCVYAPSIFLIPISLVRCKTLYADKPNKPKQAISIARNANKPNTFPNN